MSKIRIVIAVIVALGVTGYALRAPLLERIIQRQIDHTLHRVDESILSDGKLHVVLCGTAAALPDRNRAGACTAIIAGGQFWLVDTGPDSWRNVDTLNLPISHLTGVMFTHFHSDHIADFGEAMEQSWIAGRTQALQVYGPQGVEGVVAGFHQAYGLDVGYRVAHHDPQHMPPSGSETQVHTLPNPEGTGTVPVFEQDGLRVSAFKVDHAPIDPAFGYRIEYRGRVVVISGDTRKNASVIHNAQGADILLHEALNSDMVARASARAKELGFTRLAKMAGDVQNYHTTPVQAAEVASEAQVKKLVMTHIFPPLPNALARSLFLKGTAEAYSGPIVLGEDGTRLDLDPADGK